MPSLDLPHLGAGEVAHQGQIEDGDGNGGKVAGPITSSPTQEKEIAMDKKRAAIGQLESAILLWFNEADPISGSGTVSAFPSKKSFGKQVANSPATF